MSSFLDEQKDEIEAVESIYSEEIEMLSDDPIRFVDIGSSMNWDLLGVILITKLYKF